LRKFGMPFSYPLSFVARNSPHHAFPWRPSYFLCPGKLFNIFSNILYYIQDI
jgi:hypothetical protein